MSVKQKEWQKVFKYAVSIANAKRKQNPQLAFPQAMKKAWKDPKVLARKKEYELKQKATKSRPAKKVVKRVVKKTTTTKPVKRKTTTTKKKTVKKN